MELQVIIEEVALVTFEVNLISNINWNHHHHHVDDAVRNEMRSCGLELGLEIEETSQELVVSCHDLWC